MLSVSQTADAVIKRMTTKTKAHRDVYLAKRFELNNQTIVVLGASCFELCRESLGRILVKKVKSLNYQRKPVRVGFTLDGREFGIHCDASEVLVAIMWSN